MNMNNIPFVKKLNSWVSELLPRFCFRMLIQYKLQTHNIVQQPYCRRCHKLPGMEFLNSLRLTLKNVWIVAIKWTFLLTVPRGHFFCGSFMSRFCYAFVRICLLMPCGHLRGKGWPLGSRVWCLIVKLSLSHWYPGSGVVLDCIDSWYLPSFLLSSSKYSK